MAKPKAAPKKKKADKKKTETPKTPSQIIQACAAQGVTVFNADKLLTPQQVRRPTGIANLDVAIAGGFPAGALSNVYGPPSIGKSWLMWRTLAMQQKIWGDAFSGLYLSLGVYPDLAFARLHGLQVPYADAQERDFFRATYFKIHGCLPTDDEVDLAGLKVGNLHVLFANTTLKKGKGKDVEMVVNDKPMERLLQTTVEISQARACQLIVVDDIGGMPTQHRLKELYADSGTKTADYAKLLTEWPQRLTRTLQMTETGFNSTSIVAVSQVRIRIDASPYTAHDPVSSKCMDHLVATGIKLGKAAGGPAVKEEAGPRKVMWSIFKGKFGHADGAKGTYLFRPTVGIDYVGNLVDTAAVNGVIVKKPKQWIFQDEVSGIDVSAGGEGSFVDMVDESPELYEALYAKLIRDRCPGMRFK